MRLCMFPPLDHPMERGWVGRIDGDRVIHLAAQTLQSLFTGGGTAREHAVYPLAEVRLLAPVLHPPAVRVFDDQTTFAFANPAAIAGPGADVVTRSRGEPGSGTPGNSLLQGRLTLLPRVAGGGGGGGGPRRGAFRAFAGDPPRELAAERTVLKPGDLLAGPSALVEEIPRGSVVELELVGIGVLEQIAGGD